MRSGGVDTRGESRWKGFGSWSDERLRREVLFVDVGGTAVHASVYRQPEDGRAAVAVVVCQSWGTEADQTSGLAHGLALAAVELGGAACIPGYPGYGDSGGDLQTTTLADLVETVCASAETARLHSPDVVLVGIRFGAAVAAHAAERLSAVRLLLIQPALDVPSYVDDLVRRSRRGTLGGGVDGFAFGYPLPGRTNGAGWDASAVAATFPGATAVIRHAEPALERPLPEGVEDIVVPGAWGMGNMGGKLQRTAVDWIGRAA